MISALRRTLWLPALLCAAAASAAPTAPSLLDAAKSGDRAALRALLQGGANVNTTSADGTTALHWASYRDDAEGTALLIKAGAKVNAANDLGATPLWIASLNGSAAIVEQLLAAGANPNLALTAGETPLMAASRAGKADVVARLIEKKADVNARGTRDQTALMWAVSQKHPEVVQLLLAYGADVHAKSARWSQVMAVPPHGYLPYNKDIPAGAETALMFASRVGDLDSAKLLVAAGANVNDADAWGVSATSLAAHSGFRDVVAFLLSKGADPNAAAPGFAPLHEAIMRRDEQMVKALLDHGADANAPLRTWTPTRRSSHDNHFAPELIGATPFWLAARFNEPDVMRLLLAHHADPLFVHHSDKVVEGRAGEGFPHRNETTTALMAATGMGGGGEPWIEIAPAEREPLTLEVAKLMVELGVDVNVANTDGRTALDAAKSAKLERVASYLAEHGARPGVKKGPVVADRDKDAPFSKREEQQ